MFNIEEYMQELTQLLKIKFGHRLLYVGLQGSYLRGEATQSSDVDIMVIIDELSVFDLRSYKSVIQSMDYFDKSCGFICSKEDLANWNSLEICHLLNTTKDYHGTLSSLIPSYTEDDVRNFIKVSASNLYHEICHRFIHEDLEQNMARLPGSYKSVFFILQNLHYLNHKRFVNSKQELLVLLEKADFAVLRRSMDYDRGILFDFEESFEMLFSWCQNTLTQIS